MGEEGVKVTKIHYINDLQREVEATICDIVIASEKIEIKYKVYMEPSEDKKQ